MIIIEVEINDMALLPKAYEKACDRYVEYVRDLYLDDRIEGINPDFMGYVIELKSVRVMVDAYGNPPQVYTLFFTVTPDKLLPEGYNSEILKCC